MIAPADQFGPWMPGLDAAEYRARLRCLRAVVRLSTGPRGEDLAGLLWRAEREPAALAPALTALDRLAPIDRRHVLASFASLHRSA